MAGKIKTNGCCSEYDVAAKLIENRIVVADNEMSMKDPSANGCQVTGQNLHINEESIIEYDDFVDLGKELHVVEMDPLTNLTGPCIILKGDINGFGFFTHGTWADHNFKNVCVIPDIVNQRNREMIEECDVFSLQVNNENDCFRSMEEWGMAVALGKIPILEISPDNPKLKEHYLKAAESIKILEKLSISRRDAIFHCHPRLNIDYKQYTKQMNDIISLKRRDSDEAYPWSAAMSRAIFVAPKTAAGTLR